MRRLALTMLFLALCLDARAGQKHETPIKIGEQIARDRKEVRQFAILVFEMKSLNMPREKFDFWQISSELQIAAKREHAQARARWLDGKQHEGPASPGDDVQAGQTLGDFRDVADDGSERRRTTQEERVARMNGIIRESKGLEQFMALDEFDVLERYHFLMEEFLGLMRDDVLELEAAAGLRSPR